jgi:hypothetical protein
MKIFSSLAVLLLLSQSSFSQPANSQSGNQKNAQVSEQEEHEQADQNPNSDATSKDLKENLDQGLHLQKKTKVDHSTEIRNLF